MTSQDHVQDQAGAIPPTFVTGDATTPRGSGRKLLAHITNDAGRWGRGFVVALSNKWAAPEASYRRRARENGGRLPLGEVQVVPVGNDLWVANMVAQHGVRSDGQGRPPIRYEALAQCLRVVAGEARRSDATVHMPRIGSGLAGGDWEIIEGIIRAELCTRGIAVTIYSLPAHPR